MSFVVTVTPEARLDLLRVGDFLAETNPNAALRAVELIKDRMRSLRHHPARTPGTDSMRELLIRFGQSGYVVRYAILEDQIVVSRIFHMREDR